MLSPAPVGTARSRTAFTLIELLVVVAIIGILIAILLPALNSVRESGRRITCANNLRGLGEALHLYHNSFGIFPPSLEFQPGDNPATTAQFKPNWVIHLLPFFEQQELQDALDLSLPISDPSNRAARGRVLAIMLCASDAANTLKFAGTSPAEGDNWARGNYAANAGNGRLDTAGSNRILGADSPGWIDTRLRGVMGSNVSLRLDDIRDGTNKTILLGEVRAGVNKSDRRGVWAMGTAGASALFWYGSEGDDNGPNACGPSADDIEGCYAVLPIGAAALQEMCMTCEPTGKKSRQATTRSRHLGGVQIVMAGGNVHFISDFIETSGPFGPWGTVWDGLIGSNDGLIYNDGDWNLDY